jgi:hypothetical protein
VEPAVGIWWNSDAHSDSVSHFLLITKPLNHHWTSSTCVLKRDFLRSNYLCSTDRLRITLLRMNVGCSRALSASAEFRISEFE